MPETKRCRRCKEIKRRTAFPTPRAPQCADCLIEQRAAYEEKRQRRQRRAGTAMDCTQPALTALGEHWRRLQDLLAPDEYERELALYRRDVQRERERYFDRRGFEQSPQHRAARLRQRQWRREHAGELALVRLDEEISGAEQEGR